MWISISISIASPFFLRRHAQNLPRLVYFSSSSASPRSPPKMVKYKLVQGGLYYQCTQCGSTMKKSTTKTHARNCSKNPSVFEYIKIYYQLGHADVLYSPFATIASTTGISLWLTRHFQSYWKIKYAYSSIYDRLVMKKPLCRTRMTSVESVEFACFRSFMIKIL